MKHVSLSYPRSGATFLQFLIRRAQPPSYKTLVHNKLHPNSQSFYAPNITDIVILILRNYKECIIRHHITQLQNIDLDESIPAYFWAIEAFEKFQKTKHLIYYEDFITDTTSELVKLVPILKLNFSKIINNIESFRQESKIEYTKNKQNMSLSNDKLVFHSNKLSKEKQKQWDDKFRQYDPVLFDKYLERYLT